MAVELITGLGDGPHVDASDVGGFQAGIVGEEDYMLPAGERMKATVISNNKIRIAEGEAVMQGRHWRVKPNTYEDVTIENGAQGMNRKDAIVARYTKESSSGIEKVELAVLKGTPTASTPTAPVQTKGDIRGGTLRHEMLLYVVSLKGLNVESVTKEFNMIMSMSMINKSLLDMSDGMPIFTGYKNVSTSYTPEEDGFLMVDYRVTDSNTNIVITTYDTTVANMVVGSGISTLGSRVNYTIPCIKGHAYRTDRSLARGTIVCRFMPLHG